MFRSTGFRVSVLIVLAAGAVALALRPWRREEGSRERLVVNLKNGVFRIPTQRYRDLSVMYPGGVYLPLEKETKGTLRATINPGYVGPEACRECHRDYFDGASRTAHALTGRRPSSDSILGSFEPGKNRLDTRSSDVAFELRKEPNGEFVQRLLLQRDGETYIHDATFDVVFGSGKLGQTYLYWNDNALYELPVSYFTQADAWMNSPGYTDGAADFARPIVAACVQCHSTWWSQFTGAPNRFDRDDCVLGVTCESCHGPGKDHIAAAKGESGRPPAFGTINPAALRAERQVELCSLCHSGGGILIREPFSYRAGKSLADFLYLEERGDEGPGGVHSANQRRRLSLSKCFQSSESMTCTTCHDPHRHERGNKGIFQTRCLKCHELGDCETVQKAGAAFESRCIDCHMPLRGDSGTPFETTDSALLPQLRDHHITIDRSATESVLGEPAGR